MRSDVMRMEGVSSLFITTHMRHAVRGNQDALLRAQTELATGKHADVNLVLGQNVSQNLDWRVEFRRLEDAKVSLGTALAKAEMTQSTLQSIKTLATDLMSTFAGARGAQNGSAVAGSAAHQALAAFTELLNTTYNGQYLFAGQNGSVAPLQTYPGSPAETGYDASFQTTFGFSKGDPQAQTISGAAMSSFLANDLAQVFADPQWAASWSVASSVHLTERIGKMQRVDLSADANEQPFRDLALALNAAVETAGGTMNATAFAATMDFALAKVGSAIAGIGDIEARIGSGQHQSSLARDSQARQLAILQADIIRAEHVDQFEASTRVNQLMTQLQATYAVTGKILQLSLVNYI
jgi:flagellar hook-associated protein 3 FlgL